MKVIFTIEDRTYKLIPFLGDITVEANTKLSPEDWQFVEKHQGEIPQEFHQRKICLVEGAGLGHHSNLVEVVCIECIGGAWVRQWYWVDSGSVKDRAFQVRRMV